MIDLHIKPLGKQSSISSRPFQPGDWVVSYLCRNEDEELERVDLFADEAEEWEAGGPVLCRWERIVKEKDEEAASQKKQALATAEELFLALCGQAGEEDGNPGEADREEVLTLKYLLALMLERKRLLKGIPGKTGLFVHVPTKQEFKVEAIELDAEKLQKVMVQLQGLV